MTRVDYETFVRRAPPMLDPRFFLQHHTTDPSFPLPMAKLRREDSLFIEAAAGSAAGHQGIFIDIFPLDRKPSAKRLQYVHSTFIRAITRMTRARSGYSLDTKSSITSAGLRVARVVLRLFPRRMLYSIQDHLLQLFESHKGPYTVAGGSYGYRRESFEPAWLDDLETMAFETAELPVFRRVEEYLTQLYGDYMTPPPPGDRVSPHKPLEVKLP